MKAQASDLKLNPSAQQVLLVIELLKPVDKTIDSITLRLSIVNPSNEIQKIPFDALSRRELCFATIKDGSGRSIPKIINKSLLSSHVPIIDDLKANKQFSTLLPLQTISRTFHLTDFVTYNYNIGEELPAGTYSLQIACSTIESNTVYFKIL